MPAIKSATIALLMLFLLILHARASSSRVHFSVFAHTTLHLTDIIWTGHRFLYVENTTNQVFDAGLSGTTPRPVAKMPRQVEETRCAVSPESHGFPANSIYCHSPDNKIYRLSANGKHVSLFAVLPRSLRSDGALIFDSVGRFGYRLLAATGRSGGTASSGGTVFAVDSHARVRRVGSYFNRGGADEIAVAPASFGSASGQILLTVDAGKSGSLVAMNVAGHARRLVSFSDGPNPIVVLSPHQTPAANGVRPGLYVTDTVSHQVYFTSAVNLRRFAGDVLVGSELRGKFWIVTPRRSGFRAQSIATDLAARPYNLEAAVYISG